MGTKKGRESFSELSSWEKEYRRQFESIRGALRSLQLQSEERLKVNKLAKMRHSFACVDQAFSAMNDVDPNKPSNGTFIAPRKGSLQTLEQELGLVK